MKQDRSGTTLMEVLVICLILFTLGTFAVYGFTAALPDHRLKAAVRERYCNARQTEIMPHRLQAPYGETCPPANMSLNPNGTCNAGHARRTNEREYDILTLS